MSTPNHLTLGDLIARLKAEDPEKRVKIGFRNPHSYRGYYEQLAFEIARDITVGEMLAAAESAVGATFQGWKGGDYEMREYTDCWLVTERGYSMGETLGAVLLELLLADETRASSRTLEKRELIEWASRINHGRAIELDSLLHADDVSREELLNALADCVVKATDYGEQDGGFVAFYVMPTGPLHRAIPLLQRYGITVRPGFDGRESAGMDPDGVTAQPMDGRCEP